jgi:hypothetical protein
LFIFKDLTGVSFRPFSQRGPACAWPLLILPQYNRQSFAKALVVARFEARQTNRPAFGDRQNILQISLKENYFLIFLCFHDEASGRRGQPKRAPMQILAETLDPRPRPPA